jgi:hypothetical protein
VSGSAASVTVQLTYMGSVSPRADGSYGVLSSSGETVYTVRLSAEGNTCTCPAGERGVPCYHVAAVCLRDAGRVCFWCGHVGADVETFINGWDVGRELVLCPTCAVEVKPLAYTVTVTGAVGSHTLRYATRLAAEAERAELATRVSLHYVGPVTEVA